MSLGYFLLKAILDVDGHAVVIDTTTAPYVVTDAGPIEVANGALSITVIEEHSHTGFNNRTPLTCTNSYWVRSGCPS